MEYIRWFEDIGHSDINQVGGKGANLGEMVNAGMPVPPGFCLTSQAYRDFITKTGQIPAIQAHLDDIQPDDPENVERKTSEIRSLIRQGEMLAEIETAVRESYHQLTKAYFGSSYQGQPISVAVRSSATAEDLPTASFAGQQDTYLNICGEDALLEYVKRCWASLWTARAVTYRNRQGFDHHKVDLSVVVQAMVPSEVSGIMFTADPITGNRDNTVINASWGLGEAIVSGLVSPDTITVDKTTNQIINSQIAAKTQMMAYAPEGGIVTLDTAADQQTIPALPDEQILELAALGSKIEAHYASPQDIEWAYARGKYYVLQARPITTLEAPVEADTGADEYNRTMFVEIFPDPLSPVFGSAIKPIFHSMLDFTFKTWGFTPPKDIEAVGMYYNQPYFNRSYIEATFKSLSPDVREALVAQIVNPFGDRKKGTHTELSIPYLRMIARMLRFLVKFPKQMPGLVSRYQAEVAEVAAIVPEDCSDSKLVETVKELALGSLRRLVDYDFLMIAVVKRVFALLGDLLEPYFGERTEPLRNTLISGVQGNATMETNIKLWDLGQFAKGSPDVIGVFEKYMGNEVQDQLAEIEDGRAFLDELDKFLRIFGHREVRLDILYPTWSEDPEPVLNFIRGYLEVGEEHDPRRQQAHLVQQRDAAWKQVREELRSNGKGRFIVWPVVRWLLDNIEFHARERDTMHFEFTRVLAPFRRLMFALGKRWCDKGFIDQPDDVFYLTLDELEAFAGAPRSVTDLIQERRTEFETNKQRPWPNIIRGDKEIYPEGTQLVYTDGDVLKGVAGSPGKIAGPARVIRGPEDFHRLQKGDILVAPLTNPVWTPLFAIAGGIITEVGGILSHGAIVAREYGLPAVMSIPGATRQIQNGQQIEVDGSQGVVILEKAV